MAVVNTCDDEQKIRALDEAWGMAASQGKLDDVVAFYAPNASLVWPNACRYQGTIQIRQQWTEQFKTPGLKLRFIPAQIDIADCGDLASDFGAVELEATERPRQEFKYLVVWQKINGTWKV